MARNPIEVYNEAYYYYTASNDYPLNRRKAIELFHEAADLGVASAMNYLGIIYEEGEHVEKDLETAAKWYYKAYQTDDDNVHAKYNLGRMFFDGLGVGRDWDKASKLFNAVVKKGVGNSSFVYGNSCYYLACILVNRDNNHPGAYPYFVKAAKYADNADAWYSLGWYIEQGYRPKNYSDPDERIVKSEVDCYYRAAQKEHAAAMDALARRLIAMRQMDEARNLLEKAAAKGYEPAKKRLKMLNVAENGITWDLFKK